MKYIKYIFESSNYSFKTLFNKIKSDFKEFNFKFDDEDESNEIIIVKFDGEEEFTSDIADKTIEMINFLKENHYEIGNPLNIVVKFKKNSNVYNSGTTVESEDDLLKLIGKKNLISIEIECLFSPSDSINYSNAVSDLRYIQRNINNSKIIGFFSSALKNEKGKYIFNDGKLVYKYKTFNEMIEDCPSLNYNGKEYWFLNSKLNKQIQEHAPNFLVTKINDIYKIVGYIKVIFMDTKYSIDEIYVSPTFRKKGYSLIMNIFVQEKTGLIYSTKSYKTKLGHYQMIRNKRVLKYESFRKYTN